MTVFYAIEGFCIFVFLIGAALSLPALVGLCRGLGKKKELARAKQTARFAVIVPAREESKVIEANLRSIVHADYPADKRDIYVIVESERDETVGIAAKYPAVRVFVRKELSGVGKGYALDECLGDIFARGEAYDAFLILDADNVIEKDFLARMNDAYQAGYDLACGKRDNKDWNASVVCAASGLTFTAINELQNKPKNRLGKTVLISGTGFFVRAERLAATGGWPFHSLTEDYEITTYADCMGWKTCYVESAVYYDEQPVRFWQSIVQRSRWVKGFFTVRGRYAKLKRESRKAARASDEKRRFTFKSGMPVIVACIALIAYLLVLLGFFLVSLIAKNGYATALGVRLAAVFSAAYLLVVLLTVYLLAIERKHMDIKPSMRVKAALFHPIFLLSYAIAAVRAIFMKTTWERIDHTINRETDER